MNNRIFKFIGNTYVFFFYSFTLGRAGYTGWFTIIAGFFMYGINSYYIKAFIFINLILLFLRLGFNFKVVRKIEANDESLTIHYVNYGLWKKYTIISLQALRIFNPAEMYDTTSFWNKPIRIENKNEKGKVQEFFIPPHFGLGIKWNVKQEIERFIEFAKENGVEVIE